MGSSQTKSPGLSPGTGLTGGPGTSPVGVSDVGEFLRSLNSNPGQPVGVSNVGEALRAIRPDAAAPQVATPAIPADPTTGGPLINQGFGGAGGLANLFGGGQRRGQRNRSKGGGGF